MSAELLALLDELDGAREKATPGEWAQHPSDDEYVIGDVSDDGMSYADVGDTYAFRKREGSADAAMIVAAVNALPKLTAALRELLILADDMDRQAANYLNSDLRRGAYNDAASLIRETITDALGGAA